MAVRRTEGQMRKIILDFMDVTDEVSTMTDSAKKEESPVMLADTPENSMRDHKELVQEYIAQKMEFPDYYGKNLDALYDCLTDISEPTAVGFFLPTVAFDELSIDLMMYLDKVRGVFQDAERDNPEYLAVIVAEGSVPEPGAEDPDQELSDLIAELSSGGFR